MAWVTLGHPSRETGYTTPYVTLTINGRNRYLILNAAACAAAGLVVGDIVAFDQDDHRFRVRRVEPGDKAAMGCLTKQSNGPLRFSSPGTILYRAGYRKGKVEAKVFDGAVVFDASSLYDPSRAKEGGR